MRLCVLCLRVPVYVGERVFILRRQERDGRTSCLKCMHIVTKMGVCGVVACPSSRCLSILPTCFSSPNNITTSTQGFDMTAEAALGKLAWLLGRGLPVQEVREQMAVGLRGELTIEEECVCVIASLWSCLPCRSCVC
jgi:hypothetical protein